MPSVPYLVKNENGEVVHVAKSKDTACAYFLKECAIVYFKKHPEEAAQMNFKMRKSFTEEYMESLLEHCNYSLEKVDQ